MNKANRERQKGRLLVIDDDAVVRGSIVLYLQIRGFDVLAAESGEQGLAMYAEYAPDLVLCDLRMPRVDGLVVLKQIRSGDRDTPFIVVSGAGSMADAVEALRLGASDYILKPIGDLEVLEHAVHRALDTVALVRQNRRYRESMEEAIASLQENLTILREDQRAGRQIQKKMLPETPWHMDNLTIDYHIWPSLYLSGDFIDYFAIGERYVVFYLADVSGHGSSSAFITVLLKHISMSMREEFQGWGEAQVLPSTILDTINKTLLHSELGKHATVFCGVVNVHDRVLTYASAGHFPRPIFAINGHSEYLDTHGLPVGLFADANYRNVRINLSGTFSLTMFSDGILEVLPTTGLREKEESLLAVIDEHTDSVDGVITRMGFVPLKDAPDDIALLVLSGQIT